MKRNRKYLTYGIFILCAFLLCAYPMNAQNKEKENKVITKASDNTKHYTIFGTVVDEHNQPLPGATVINRGTSQGVTTGVDGRFVIQLPKKDNIFLDVSFMGMKSQAIRVTKNDRIVIKLKEDAVNLKEAEVIGNGFFKQNKNTFTGSATKITKEELLNVSTVNPIKAIATLTPGMVVVENNAAGSNPNAIPDLIIRGTTSLITDESTEANTPMVIMDGQEISLEELYDLDIHEIADVTVLKDASATILYGERAANGVIVVERERVKESKVRLTYNFTPMLSYPDLSSMNLTNAEQKLELERLAGLYETTDGSLDQAYAYKLENIRRGVNTNWIEAPLRVSFGHSHSLNMTGRGQNLDYRASARFSDKYGVMRGDNRRAYDLNFMFGYHLTNKLTISYRASFSIVNSKETPYGSFADYTKLNPYEPVYDQDGHYIPVYYFDPFNNSSSKKIENPLYNAQLSSFSTGSNQSLSNSVDLRWDLNKHFYFTTQANLKLTTGQNDSYVSPDDSKFATTTNAAEKGSYMLTTRNGNSWSGKIVGSYRNSFGNGGTALSINAGADIAHDKSNYSRVTAIGFMKDNLNDIKYAMSYSKNSKPMGSENLSARMGFFANSNFILNNRYFADLSYRTSGSSKFGKNHRFAPFWAFGLGWNIHNEPFLKREWLNTLRLRWSLGYTGSVNFPYYQAITTYRYNQNNTYYTGIGAVPITMGNPDLKWQKTLNNNIGLTATVFDNRITGTLDYYQQNTFDLLMPIDLPPSVGVSNVKVNFGEIRNSGIEFSLTGQIIKQKDLFWSMTISGSHNYDKISKISDALSKTNKINNTALKPKLLYIENGSQYDIYAVRSAGIDPASGQEIFITKDGHYTFDYNEDDKVAVGNTNPIIRGSWISTVNYKGLSVSLTATYTFGGDIYNTTLYEKVENIDPYFNVDERAFTDRWKQPGDVTRFLGLNQKKAMFNSSRFVERQNEFYLSGITVNYDIRSKWLSKFKLKRLVVGFAYDDVFRISTVKYERGTSYPYCRSVNLTFRPTF